MATMIEGILALMDKPGVPTRADSKVCSRSDTVQDMECCLVAPTYLSCTTREQGFGSLAAMGARDRMLEEEIDGHQFRASGH